MSDVEITVRCPRFSNRVIEKMYCTNCHYFDTEKGCLYREMYHPKNLGRKR